MFIPNETIASLEAVLFACGGPVEGERLRELLGLSPEELTAAAEALEKALADNDRGIMLIRVESAYQLCTKPFVSETVKKALELRKAPPLSKAALEVLAIVAYHQPVTRSFIEMVRGVDSSSIVSSLCDKGLIAERGFMDAPGRPVLFGTTDAFLRCFGLDSIKDLPEASSMPEQLTLQPAETEETAQQPPESDDGASPAESAE